MYVMTTSVIINTDVIDEYQAYYHISSKDVNAMATSVIIDSDVIDVRQTY